MRSRGGSSVRSSHLGTSPGTAAPCRTLGGLIKNPSPAVPEPEQPLRGPQRELSPRGCRDRRLRSLVPVPVPAGEEGRRGKAGVRSVLFPPTPAWCPGWDLGQSCQVSPVAWTPPALDTLSILAGGTGGMVVSGAGGKELAASRLKPV